MTSRRLTRIVTCYRQWELLGKWAGNSALRQDDVAWLIINDDPQVTCPVALQAQFQNLGAEIHTPTFNLGRSQARNLGVRLAATPYVEHIDGDDMPLPIPQDILDQLDGTFDLGAFPVFERNAADVNDILPPDTLEVKASWALFLPTFSPVDVRPAGTLWRTAFFQKIGGYDARFESGEDFQLALRADLSKAVVRRFSSAKQVYTAKCETRLRDPMFVDGHLRVWHWLASNRWQSSQTLALWQGKDTLQHFLNSAAALWKARRSVLVYLKSKLLK